MDHLTFETKDHVVYAICSQSCKKLNATAVAQAIRPHGSIEVRLHGQRDVRMREDANKATIGAAPRALACLRNWAIAIVEKYQRLNCMRKISHAWQSLSYNTEKGLSQLEAMV
jgi:predicted transposase YbfD/YdcC